MKNSLMSKKIWLPWLAGTVTSAIKKQSRLMNKIPDIAGDQFHARDISLPISSESILKKNLHNLSLVIPNRWIRPTPAHVNPCQYVIGS